MKQQSLKKVAKCPYCEAPHRYIELHFPIENDKGYWKIRCQSCNDEFVIELSNPRESSIFCENVERYEEVFSGPDSCVATDIATVCISDLNQTRHRFNFDAEPIYRCQSTASNLETIARQALTAR